ncbi:hypothetical protein SAMN05421779_103492 [Insolitispirillum peregrinum]|uniref:Phosphotransferase enzyme family protein n=2 Tax=Insolitispirillum peregrinum TaxID=80876 RepID=A0A1N7LQH5_9PROT|nr:hypothetical protein SAMN05421779_103492 [Insolitispirillum peregrinum]
MRMTPPPLIGLDLDNTLIDYETLFCTEAVRMGLFPAGVTAGKAAVRAHIQAHGQGDIDWQHLQTRVYGEVIDEAPLFAGAAAFVQAAQAAGIPLVIISHKSRHTHISPDGPNLRDAARRWLAAQPDLCGLVEREQVHFTDTRADKIALIRALGCTVFVDDLATVLDDPAFPPEVLAVHFAPGPAPVSQRAAVRCARWEQVTDTVFGTLPLARLHEVCGKPLSWSTPVGGGRNNRLLPFSGPTGEVLLKVYPHRPERQTDSFEAERAALEFCQTVPALAGATPRLLGSGERCCLLERMEGVPALTDRRSGDVAAMLAFVQTLWQVSHGQPQAQALGAAAEACSDAASVLAQVQQRLERLRPVAHPALQAFLHDQMDPAVQDACRRLQPRLTTDQPLPRALQTLSPADFGLHNALRHPDGRLVFLDFEYFGWDDPVKLVAETALHPGHALSAAERSAWLHGCLEFYRQRDEDFPARLADLGPLFALRWALIALNEFLPRDVSRRQFAGALGQSPEALETRRLQQLETAQSLISAWEPAG